MKIKLNPDYKWQVTKDKWYDVHTDSFREQFFLDDLDNLWYIDIERDWANCMIAEVSE